jgi:hypothetical protein
MKACMFSGKTHEYCKYSFIMWKTWTVGDSNRLCTWAPFADTLLYCWIGRFTSELARREGRSSCLVKIRLGDQSWSSCPTPISLPVFHDLWYQCQLSQSSVLCLILQSHLVFLSSPSIAAFLWFGTTLKHNNRCCIISSGLNSLTKFQEKGYNMFYTPTAKNTRCFLKVKDSVG